MPRPQSIKGFSLIEAAIVLGIIGLVIGGIWVAAASVAKRQRLNAIIDTVSLLNEKATAFRKTTTFKGNLSTSSSYSIITTPYGYNLANMISGLPGGYKKATGGELQGGASPIVAWVDFLPDGSANPPGPYFILEIFFNTRSLATASSQKLDSSLCVALSNFFLSKNLGTVPLGEISISWLAVGDWSLAGAGGGSYTTWATGDPPTDVGTNCDDTTGPIGLRVNWLL